MPTRRLALLCAVLARPALAQAPAWPAGALRILVPFAAADPVARLLAPGLGQRLGVPVTVENRPGAIGTEAAAKAPPDGLTWLLTGDGHATLPALLPSLNFDLTRDLDPVMLIGGAPYVIACRPEKPFRGLADILAAARDRPDALTYGSAGTGTIGHLGMLLLQAESGTRMGHRPYPEDGLAVSDTAAGDVDMMIGSAALLAPHVAGGTLRAVVQFGPERLPALRDVATALDSGLDLQAESWWGVFAPHATPVPVIARMNAVLRDTLSEDAVRQRMLETEQARLVLSDPETLATFLTRQIALWGGVVRAHAIRPD